ncbi:unnamed protein product [Prorocentrum cordatum]|uniref:Palmitoyl-protein thioesterase ABHD10, mitochondrial n=1 Tax=Prorocentrum cordatum TaxID=2364126 RepID=A0ABN9PW25_9DINO|nr:unnamed protein product [Polarella glacialis]
MSSMVGSKALALEEWCRGQGRQFTRFDYAGCGQSSGDFAEGTLGSWADDALAVLDTVTDGPQVVVGASMGGWIMLLLALRRPERVAGLVGVAAAPDFVLRWQRLLDDHQRQALEKNGCFWRPSRYSEEPYLVTRQLLEEGRSHLLLQGDKQIAITCPLRLLHGMRDPDVPWQASLELCSRIAHDDVEVRLVKAADHRMSRPEDLRMLLAVVEELCARAGE